jgi:hypothetical protein
MAPETVLARKRLGQPDPADAFLQEKLAEISMEIEKLPESASLGEIDAIIEEHFNIK